MHPGHTLPHGQGSGAFLQSCPTLCVPKKVLTFPFRSFFPWLWTNFTESISVLFQGTIYITLFTEETFPLPHQPFPRHCTHQGICIVSPREDLPSWVWDKSSALTLPWLIRTPQVTFSQWGSLLSSWGCWCSGSLVRTEGDEGGELGGRWALWAQQLHMFIPITW